MYTTNNVLEVKVHFNFALTLTLRLTLDLLSERCHSQKIHGKCHSGHVFRYKFTHFENDYCFVESEYYA